MKERYYNTYTGEEMNKYKSDAFMEARKLFNLPPVQERSTNQNKLSKKRNKFLNGHICKKCGGQMQLLVDGTNIMECNHCHHRMFLRERKVMYAQGLFTNK